MKLFICYRRKSWGHVHLLAEKLKKQIKGRIFVDFEGIDDTDFERSIARHLRESDVVLVVVTEYTFAPDRIHDSNDWVRREIALALKLKKPIVLICIDNHHPPSPSILPKDIRDITRMQGIPFYPEYFDAAVKKVVEFVNTVLTSTALSKEDSSPVLTKITIMPESNADRIHLPPIPTLNNQTTEEILQENDKDQPNAIAFLSLSQLSAVPLIQQTQTVPSNTRWRRIVVFTVLLLLIVSIIIDLMFNTLPRTHTAITTNTLTATANGQATAYTQAADAYAKYVSTNGMLAGFNAQRTRVNPYEQILSPLTVSGLTKQWAYQTGSSVNSSPAVANGLVYVSSKDGNLYAIDATSGHKKWEYQTGNAIFSSPAVANGIVYVGLRDGNLYAIDATFGNKKWAYQTGNAIFSSPVVTNGIVYIGSNDGNLYAIDAFSGHKKWAYQTGNAIFSSPAVANGVVYFGSRDWNLYAIDATSGHKKWAYQTRGIVDSSPAVANGLVYVGSNDGSLYAIDAFSGHKKWEYHTGNFVGSSPAVANGLIYVGSRDGNLYAITFSGEKKWVYPTGNFVDSSPTIANGIAYVGSRDGKLYAIDAFSGHMKWAYPTGGFVYSSPAVANGVVYVGSDDSNLYAFGLAIPPS